MGKLSLEGLLFKLKYFREKRIGSLMRKAEGEIKTAKQIPRVYSKGRRSAFAESCSELLRFEAILKRQYGNEEPTNTEFDPQFNEDFE